MSQFDVTHTTRRARSAPRPAATGVPRRRVRDEVKDGVAVAAASVAASVGLVLIAAVLMRLAG